MKDTTKRRLLVTCACLYNVLYAGAFSGFGSMQLFLEETGAFHSKCIHNHTSVDTTEEEICSEQTNALVSVASYSLMTGLISPVLGQISDHFGARTVAFIMAAVTITFLALLMVSVSLEIDLLLYVAFSFAAIGTWCSLVLMVPTGLLFHGHLRFRIIVLLNGCFNAGSITFLGIWGLYKLGMSATAALGLYIGIAVSLFSSSLYFWTTATPQQEFADLDLKSLERLRHDHSDESRADTAEFGSPTEPHHTTVDSETFELQSSPPERRQAMYVALSEQKETDSLGLLSDCKPTRQLLSFPFLATLLFWVAHFLHNLFVLSTTRDHLAFLGDDEQDNKYLSIYSLLLPTSILAVPAVDFVLLKFGHVGGLQAVNILSLLYGVTRVASSNLNVQVFGFLLYSVFRCFLFGVFSSFIPTLLSPEIAGKAVGIAYFSSGIAGFLNVRLASFAVETKDGDFMIPHLVYTGLAIPCIGLAWYLGRVVAREQPERKRRYASRLAASIQIRHSQNVAAHDLRVER